MASASVTSRICFLALAIVLGCSPAHAQSLKLGVHGRAIHFLPSAETSEFSEPISDGGYGFGPWAPSVDLEVRYSPYRGIITVAGDVSYTPLKGSGATRWLDDSGTPRGGREYEGHLYIASFGVQFKMLQGATRPYLGARMQGSFISEITVNYPGVEHSEMLPNHVNSFSCFGIGVLGGVEVDLDSIWSLDIAARYNFTHVGNYSERGYDNVLSFGIGIFYEVL